MKRLVMSGVVLVVACFILAEVFGAGETEYAERERITASRQRYEPRWTRRPKADANTVPAGPEFLSDPNAIREKIKGFEGLEKALDDVTKTGRDEMREWMRGPVEERKMLAEAAHKQVLTELGLIRQLAVEEGASKTAAAIEAVLLERQQRFGEVLRRAEMARRRMRRNERMARGYRRGGRYMREPYPDGGPYPDEEMDRGRYGPERGRYPDRGAYRERGAYPEEDWDRQRDMGRGQPRYRRDAAEEDMRSEY